MNDNNTDNICVDFKKKNNIDYVVINFNKTLNTNVLDIFNYNAPNFFVINFDIVKGIRTITLKQLMPHEINYEFFDPAKDLFSKITFSVDDDLDMNMTFLCAPNFLDEEKINKSHLFKYKKITDFKFDRKVLFIYLD